MSVASDAEMLGGLVDGNATICHGPTVMAIQDRARSAAPRRDRNRADLDIYWGATPKTHTETLKPHSVFQRGFFTGQGAFGRQIMSSTHDVHHRRARRSPPPVKPGTDFEVLNALMTISAGFEPHESFTEVTGLAGKISQSGDMIKDARFGVIWVGLGIAAPAQALQRIDGDEAEQLGNKYGKFVILANRGHCNVAGFNEVPRRGSVVSRTPSILDR